MARKPYPSDVTDEEWDFVAPYLTLMTEDAPQREHDLREVFNGMRYVVRGGRAWRMMPNDLPPWSAVYQQAQRWIAAGVFEAMTQDLRHILRLLGGRREEPSADGHAADVLAPAHAVAAADEGAAPAATPSGGRPRRR